MQRQRQSRLNRSNKTGYESYRVERVNEEGKKYYETKYRQVQYREFFQEASVEVACTFKFINTTTGELVSTETVYGRASDNIRYISYDGNSAKFFLGGSTGARTGSSGRADRDRMMAVLEEAKGYSYTSDDLEEIESVESYFLLRPY